MKVYFPTILERDETGSFTAEVVGNGVNGEGDTSMAALDDAAPSLQEVVWWSV